MISAYHNELHCSRTLHYQSISAASPPFSKTMHTLRLGCRVAVGQVFGRCTGLAIAGGREQADAGLARRQAGRLSHCPDPATAFADEIRATHFCPPSRKKGWQVPVSPARENGRGCQGAARPCWPVQSGKALAASNRRTVGRGSKGGTPLGRDSRDAVPRAGFVRTAVLTGRCNRPVKAGSRGRIRRPLGEGHCAAMYNLAIPAFVFFAAPWDVRRSQAASA